MKKWVQKYTGWLRRFRLNYFLYNTLIAKRHLKPALAKLKDMGVAHPLWRFAHDKVPSSSEPAFSQNPHREPPSHLSNATLQKYPAIREQFMREGAARWTGIIDEKDAIAIQNDVKKLLGEGKLTFNYTGTKIMDAWHHSETIRDLARSERITGVLASLVGSSVQPFQTIYFEKGSQQAAHSDYFHMTTYPDFGLIAIWIALEPIHQKNGPVFYYPGSHNWKPIYNTDLPLKENGLFLDPNPNRSYERYLNKTIEEAGVVPETFEANPGDALIWHANLVHGGSKQIDPQATRRSLVIHYFATNAICYHEVSQRLAVLRSF